MDTIKVEAVLPAPLNRVWLAWTSSEQIAQWLSSNANIDPRPGGFFELYFKDTDQGKMSTKGCVFIRIEPRSSLTFTWKGPDGFASLMNDPSRLTTVRVDFHEVGNMTRVIINHMGWGDGEEWERARRWHEKAWMDALERLRSHLESE